MQRSEAARADQHVDRIGPGTAHAGEVIPAEAAEKPHRHDGGLARHVVEALRDVVVVHIDGEAMPAVAGERRAVAHERLDIVVDAAAEGAQRAREHADREHGLRR